MYERKIPVNCDCGLTVTMKVLGGKWKVCIIDAIRRGHTRPSALHREITEAVPRVIHMQLRELEECRIVQKTVFPGLPLRVEYALTDLGRSLLPLVDALDHWGKYNCEAVMGASVAVADEVNSR